LEIETPALLTPSFYLVSYTMPTEEMAERNVRTPLDLIAYCARVSNPANQSNSATARNLLRYLIEHKHWSPLEMVDVTFGLTTARDISHQQVRHRSMVFQEFSQRYAEVDENRHCLREARLEHPTNRQMSVECLDQTIIDGWIQHQLEVLEVSRRAYNWARQHKIAKECARVVLPEGLTLSDLYIKGSLRSWVHYLDTRGEGSGTQKEHMQIALGLAKAITRVFPTELTHAR
jgi:thymidylate synthase (FAD)